MSFNKLIVRIDSNRQANLCVIQIIIIKTIQQKEVCLGFIHTQKVIGVSLDIIIKMKITLKKIAHFLKIILTNVFLLTLNRREYWRCHKSLRVEELFLRLG